MILDDQQREASLATSNTCIRSCPGSGKTRTIVAKVLNCISDLYETPRRIACITYTNAAVAEIENRLAIHTVATEYEYCEVGTIHSFCLNNILRYFSGRTPELASGFSLLPIDSESFQDYVADLLQRHRIKQWAKERFYDIHRLSEGELHVPDGVTHTAAADFHDHITEQGWITFGDILYYSLRLVSDHEFIAKSLAKRFAWIVLDEFQDTTYLQTEILKRIFDCGCTRLFFVGDENQSIFGFAGAKPILFEEVAEYTQARTDIRLLGNYRSSQPIVEHANSLMSGSYTMEALGENAGITNPVEVVAYQSYAEGIIDYLIPQARSQGIALGDIAVLGPQWPTLFHVARALRQQGIPVTGPGARPYRRTRSASDLIEGLCAYSLDRDQAAIRGLQRTLFFTLLSLNSERAHFVYEYDGKRLLAGLVARIDALLCVDLAAAEWVQVATQEIAELLTKFGVVDETGLADFLDAGTGMANDVEETEAREGRLSASDLAVLARPKDCLHLMTIHRSKGREFDAVGLVDIEEDKIPHFTAQTTKEVEEARRLLYVATTRARKRLVYIENVNSPKRRSRFVDELFTSI